jgi:tetratricopeptide (TPR) repeat protein
MLHSSLHVHDSPSEQQETHHNPEVAHLLGLAYSSLRRALHRAQSYDEACQLADVCLSLAMSSRQRMRTHYALGSALLGINEDREGILALNEAIHCASDLPDPGAFAELAYLASAASAHSFLYQMAADYARTAYGILRFLARDQVSADVELEMSVLTILAASEFSLAQYPAAEQHLQLARRLTSPSLDNSRSIASIAWMESLLYRWSGQPERALRHVLPALDTYIRTAGSPAALSSVARLSCVVSDIALDLAQTVSAENSPTARASYLTLAHPHVERALLTATESNDDIGECLAVLTQARYDSLAGRNVDRIQVIETIIQRARELPDISLLAHGYTVLAEGYSALGEKEAALTCYRRTLETVDGTDIPSMGTFARRQLLLAQEMDE